MTEKRFQTRFFCCIRDSRLTYSAMVRGYQVSTYSTKEFQLLDTISTKAGYNMHMKNYRRGFIVPVLLIIIVLLVIGGGVYIYKNKKQINDLPPQTDTAVKIPSSTASLPPSCTDQPESKAVITSLSSYSGPVGTDLEIRGCNFAGFEGDKNAIIENSEGVIGILYGESGSTANVIKVTLKSPLCSQNNSYSGLPCGSYLTLTPGTYKIYAMPWGTDTKSNLVNFTIQ